MKRRKIRRRYAQAQASPMGNLISTGVGNLVAIPLIGATSTQVAALPAGSMERTIAGIVPGVQSIGLVGANMGALGMGTAPRRRRRRY